MNDSVESVLKEGFEQFDSDDSGFIIVSRGSSDEDESGFFQYAGAPGSWRLDFPVISSNENTPKQAEKLEDIIKGSATGIDHGPAGGEGIGASIDSDINLVEVSKRIVEEIWGKNAEIETEVQID